MDSPYTPQLRNLIERAQQDDDTALPELRHLLDETPELWQQVGDLTKHCGAQNYLAGIAGCSLD